MKRWDSSVYIMFGFWLVLAFIFQTLGYRLYTQGGLSELDAKDLYWCCFTFWVMVPYALSLRG